MQKFGAAVPVTKCNPMGWHSVVHLRVWLQEVEKRKKYEEAYKSMSTEKKLHVVGGPDYEVSAGSGRHGFSYLLSSPLLFVGIRVRQGAKSHLCNGVLEINGASSTFY